MELFKSNTQIDFMGKRGWVATASVLVCLLSLALLFTKGLNFGLDFTGGTQIEVRYEQAVEVDSIRELLLKANFESVKVTHYGTTQDVLIRLANQEGISEEALGKEVIAVLQTANDAAELRRVEFVGSEVGEQLAEQGSLAVLVAILATMIYIAFRFEYRFAISAAVALMHDPIIILGIFAFYQIEFDLAALAAILAVLGYSLNDTIVVFDRVRENFRKMRKGTPLEIMNLSLNQTLSRTIMTSALTLLVVVALFFWGGESLHGFSTALLVGIIVGTFSSIYIAGALALSLGLSKQDMMPSQKQVDEMP